MERIMRSSVGQKDSVKEEIENEGLHFRAFSVGHRADAVSAVVKQ